MVWINDPALCYAGLRKNHETHPLRTRCSVFFKMRIACVRRELQETFKNILMKLTLLQLATGWTVWGSNPSGGRDFPHLSRPALGPTQPPVQWYRVFPRGKERPGRDADPSPLLVPWWWKGRAIPLLPLWAVRPLQSLSVCTRVHFTLPQCPYKGELYLTSVPVQGCTLPYFSACTRVHFTLPQCLYKGALYLPQCLCKGALYLTSVPVQECTLPYLSACTRVHFTLPQCLTRVHFTLPHCLYKSALYLTSVPVQGCTLPTSVPVQGCTLPYLSACTKVHFTLPQCLYKGALYLTSVPVQGCTLPYLSACTRVHFTLPQCLYKGALYLTSVPVQECTLPYLSACTSVHFTIFLRYWKALSFTIFLQSSKLLSEQLSELCGISILLVVWTRHFCMCEHPHLLPLLITDEKSPWNNPEQTRPTRSSHETFYPLHRVMLPAETFERRKRLLTLFFVSLHPIYVNTMEMEKVTLIIHLQTACKLV